MNEIKLQDGRSLLDVLYPIGTIIHNAILDTEEKVKATYGGNAWEKIQGRFLLGQSSGYAIDSKGGETSHDHKYMIAYHAHYGLIVGSDDNLIYTRNYASNEWQVSTYNREGQADKPLNQGVSTAALQKKNGISFYINENNTSSASSMPPYTVVYIWKRTA